MSYGSTFSLEEQGPLEKIGAKLGTSRAVFVSNTDRNLDRVGEFFLQIKDQYKVDLEKFTDPVERIVAQRWYESYDRNKKQFELAIGYDTIYAELVNSLTRLYTLNSGLKSPNQSKLYKWLRSMENRYNHKHKYRDGFIALYRYAAANIPMSGGGTEFGKDPNSVHVKNVLAILEKMRDKDEQ